MVLFVSLLGIGAGFRVLTIAIEIVCFLCKENKRRKSATGSVVTKEKEV